MHSKLLDVNASPTTMTATQKGEMEKSTTIPQSNMVRVFDKMLSEEVYLNVLSNGIIFCKNRQRWGGNGVSATTSIPVQKLSGTGEILSHLFNSFPFYYIILPSSL